MSCRPWDLHYPPQQSHPAVQADTMPGLPAGLTTIDAIEAKRRHLRITPGTIERVGPGDCAQATTKASEYVLGNAWRLWGLSGPAVQHRKSR